jgi:ABC-type glycerol-3-phosphate transport system substrate-binding protein
VCRRIRFVPILMLLAALAALAACSSTTSGSSGTEGLTADESPIPEGMPAMLEFYTET